MMLPMRGIEEGFTGGDESRPATELQAAAQAAASMAAGRCEMDSGRGRARPGLRRRGRGGGRGKERLGATNRREARPRTDGAGAARLCSARARGRRKG